MFAGGGFSHPSRLLGCQLTASLGGFCRLAACALFVWLARPSSSSVSPLPAECCRPTNKTVASADGRKAGEDAHE